MTAQAAPRCYGTDSEQLSTAFACSLANPVAWRFTWPAKSERYCLDDGECHHIVTGYWQTVSSAFCLLP